MQANGKAPPPAAAAQANGPIAADTSVLAAENEQLRERLETVRERAADAMSEAEELRAAVAQHEVAARAAEEQVRLSAAWEGRA